MAGARPPRQIATPVIADAGPLIALAKVGRLGLMKRLFSKVFTTVEVIAELGLTKQAGGRYPASMLVIDERLGRREARRLGIANTGTTGLLCAGKSRGLIKAAVPALAKMRAADYFPGDKLIEAARIEAVE